LSEIFGFSGFKINIIALACPSYSTTRYRIVFWPHKFYTGVGLFRCDISCSFGYSTEVDDVANAILFLLSDSAGNINGINLVVDGGISIQG